MPSADFNSLDSLSSSRALRPSDASGPVSFLPPESGTTQLNEVIPVSGYLRMLRRNWLWITLIVVVCTSVAVLLIFIVPPRYKATARLRIDDALPSTVVGSQTAQSGSADLDQAINTDMQLIQSDAVLRPVAEKFHLLGSSSTIMANTPVVLKGLSVAHVPNSRLVDITYSSGDPELAAEVANSVAHAYIAHEQEMRVSSSLELSAFMQKQIDQLKGDMQTSAEALAAYQKQLGVINPDQKTSILNSRLLQLNGQYTDAENERIRWETEYRAMASGSTSALEASPQATELKTLEERKRVAEENLAQATTIYGPSYPEYKRAANTVAELSRQDQDLRQEIKGRIASQYQEAQHRESLLRASVAETKNESDALSTSSFEYEQLKRDAESNTNLYNELYRKVKESGINAGFASSSIRIADEARPPESPFFPNRRLLIPLGFMLSLIGSVVTVILGQVISDRLRDPEQARKMTGLQLLGTFPDVRTLPILDTSGRGEQSALAPRKTRKRLLLLDFYHDCVSSALSSILNTRTSRRPRSIIVTSPGPGEGKSSCTAYLAAEHAIQGKRTLVVDADLRCPSQHRIFGLPNNGGLARIIEEGVPFQEVRQSVPTFSKLDLIVAGTSSKLSSGRVGQIVTAILKECAGEYDLILIDAPPMLNLAEPIQIACSAEGVILVAQAGRTRRRLVLDAISTLHSVHANVMGLILNRVSADIGDDYDRYRAYAQYSRRRAAV